MRSLLLIAFSAIFMASCNDGKKIKQTTKNEDGSVTTTSYDVSNLQDNTDEMTKKMDALKTMKPLSLEQLKAFLPEEINGIKRSKFNTNSAMGFGMGEAEYDKDENTQLQLMVYDCAGEAGSGIYGMNFWTKMNMESESSDGYTKSIDFMGGRAVETFEKNQNQSTLTYLANDRLLVVITGKNMSADEIKQAAKTLNLKVS